MGFNIIWTPKAVKTFGDGITYLQENWTDKEILNFTARVNEFLKTLKGQPLMFRKSTRLRNTHVGVIIKQVSLVYRVKSRNHTIELIAFIDNRQSPKKNQA